MGKLTTIACSVLCAFSLSACTSATNSQNASPSATVTSPVESNPALNDTNVDEKQNKAPDCDAYLQEMTDACIQIAIYDEQGNIRIDVDLNGNDLGPINKELAIEYCSCFTKSAFRDFGCSAVMQDELLNQSDWVKKYAPLQQACVDDPKSGDTPQINDNPEISSSDDTGDAQQPSIDESSEPNSLTQPKAPPALR